MVLGGGNAAQGLLLVCWFCLSLPSFHGPREGLEVVLPDPGHHSMAGLRIPHDCGKCNLRTLVSMEMRVAGPRSRSLRRVLCCMPI